MLSARFLFLFWVAIMSADITTGAATGATFAFPRHEQTFPTLTHHEIERMRRFGELRTYKDGEALFETGKPGPGMFVVLSGHVAITQRDGLGHVTPVIDQGPGIRRDELERVFERFYRGPCARAGSTPGMGVGLALSQAIIHAHGGSIGASNAEPAGSVFEVRLPSVD